MPDDETPQEPGVYWRKLYGKWMIWQVRSNPGGVSDLYAITFRDKILSFDKDDKLMGKWVGPIPEPEEATATSS